MPNLNGTGPRGQGPLSGRRVGCCRDCEKSKTINKTEEIQEVIYGLGCGGRPRGGGGFEKTQGRRREFGRNHTFGK